MSSEKYLIIILVTLILAPLVVVAKPGHMGLSRAINQAVCRTKVKYNTNELRIPRVIKELKCEAQNTVRCPADKNGKPRCSTSVTSGAYSCMEAFDTVLVLQDNNLDRLNVAVGCFYIQEKFEQAIIVSRQ